MLGRRGRVFALLMSAANPNYYVRGRMRLPWCVLARSFPTAPGGPAGQSRQTQPVLSPARSLLPRVLSPSTFSLQPSTFAAVFSNCHNNTLQNYPRQPPSHSFLSPSLLRPFAITQSHHRPSGSATIQTTTASLFQIVPGPKTLIPCVLCPASIQPSCVKTLQPPAHRSPFTGTSPGGKLL